MGDIQKEEKYKANDKNDSGMIEYLFESFLWSTRFLVIFAVVSSVLASFTLFVIGSVDMFEMFGHVWNYYINHDLTVDVHTSVIADVIGAIDIYLIAVVLLLFSFGLYELFISHIDPAEDGEASAILQIHSLDALKDKIAKVIVMALIVKYFQMVLGMEFNTPLEMTYLALSILALALALYFLHQPNIHKSSDA